MIIAIDGTVGSGKSTVARKLAKRLGFIHLNSGALYRAVAFLAKERNLPLDKPEALVELAKDLKFDFILTAEKETIFLVNKKDITSSLVTEEIGEITSRVIGNIAQVREILSNVQKQVAQINSLVVEGRDSGTVVFPQAELKLFLDASLEVRSKRRFEELQGKSKLSEQELKNYIENRDLVDSKRDIAPLVKAEDAELIDTSNINVDQVIELIMQKLKVRGYY